MFKSAKVLKTVNPHWNKEENILNLLYEEELVMAFYDWDRVGKHSFLGSVRINPLALRIFAEGS